MNEIATFLLLSLFFFFFFFSFFDISNVDFSPKSIQGHRLNDLKHVGRYAVETEMYVHEYSMQPANRLCFTFTEPLSFITSGLPR
jgi:hypothetical protein